MTPDEFKAVRAFEQGLKPGAPVLARWTNCNRHYHAAAEVLRVNNSTVRVRLTAAIEGSYPAGQEIVCPLLVPSRRCRWSHNNRVEPADGYQPVERRDDTAVRAQIAAELPELVERHHDRMDALDQRIRQDFAGLVGRRIVGVRALTPEEARAAHWYVGPMTPALVVELDDGGFLIPQSDVEGNQPGWLMFAPGTEPDEHDDEHDTE